MNNALRLADHPALAAACATSGPVIPLYVYDNTHDNAPGAASRWWLLQSLSKLDASLKKLGSGLVVRRGTVADVVMDVCTETGACGVYMTRGYSEHDKKTEEYLHDFAEKNGLTCKRYAGRLLLEPEQVVSKSGTPYSVFTPFWKQALSLIDNAVPLPVPQKIQAPVSWPATTSIGALGLEPKPASWAEPIAAEWQVGEEAAIERLDFFVDATMDEYQTARDIPGVDGTSKISPYLAFGEISPRQIWHKVSMHLGDATKSTAALAYLRELGWRDFSYHQLFYNPEMRIKPLKAKFLHFPWHEGTSPAVKAWQKGMTGFPIVDAGMRQLWQTGWMHNRVRMIVGSFLVKDLLWHWHEGETWFWDTLVDADIASNAASWQWVAGCGADASPYFRIFNPVTQGEKFDPAGAYIRSFVPELCDLPNEWIHKPFDAPLEVLAVAGITLGHTYPAPLVDRKKARASALAALASIKD
ncbi:cryptochrome/photolyase family protein [Kordiimonas pumila]|uniref:Cryptochrome/photolyase family protein n=2 Tax=Kordiimonas pumila TaxID=2161677 RepID=A0ABV7D683_9PROT